jgi:PII-like signaling protein
MIPTDATLLRMYLNGSDRWHGKPLYRAVVEAARSRHLAGVSVFLVDLCYGAHRQIHDAKSEYSSFAIPVVLDFVDATAKLDAFLVEVDSMVSEGLVVLRPVRVVCYAGTSEPSQRDQVGVKADGARLSVIGGPDTMKIEGAAQQVTVYIGSADTWHGRNLSAAIIEQCRSMGMAGATASLGVMGFGKNSRIHRAHLLGLSEDLPERIEIVDRPERIEQLLPVLEEMVGGGLIVVEDVHVVRYLHEPKG